MADQGAGGPPPPPPPVILLPPPPPPGAPSAAPKKSWKNRPAATAGESLAAALASRSSDSGADGAGSGADTVRGSYYYADKSPTGFTGLENQGATCYLNSLLQHLYLIPEFRHALFSWRFEKTDERRSNKDGAEAGAEAEVGASSIPYQLQRLFAQLELTKRKAVNTKALTRSFGWTQNDAFMQQDAQELRLVLIDALERTFARTHQFFDIRAMFQGTLGSQVQCPSCKHISRRDNEFTDLTVMVQGMRDLNESLNAFFTPELVSGYRCQSCGNSVDALLSNGMHSAPPVLLFALRRFDFDFNTFARVKIHSYFEFPFELDLQPQLGSEAPELYDLATVFVHSGGAQGGHYWVIAKDFTRNIWIKFNDSEVNEVTLDEVRSTYGADDRKAVPSAYMLAYRKRAPLPPAYTIPTEIVQEIEKQTATFLAEKEQFDMKRDTLHLKILFRGETHQVPIYKKKSIQELLQVVHEQLKLEVPLDCIRLRFYNSIGETPGPVYEHKEGETIDSLHIFSGQWLLLEERKPDEQFVDDQAAATTLVSVIRYRRENGGTYDEPIKINLERGASIAQLEDLIANTLEIPRERLLVLKLISSEVIVTQLRAAADEPVGVEALVNRDIEAGMTVYAEELEHVGDPSAVAEKFELERNQLEIRFNVPGERMPAKELTIDKRKPLSELKSAIAHELHLDVNEFKMCDNAMSKTELKDLAKPIGRSGLFDGSAVFITLGKPLVLGQHNVTLFRYELGRVNQAATAFEEYREIGKLIVEGTWTLEQLEAAALQRYATEFADLESPSLRLWRVKVGKRAGRPLPLERPLYEALPSLKDGTELALQLPSAFDPAKDLSATSLLVQTRQWLPSQWQLALAKNEFLLSVDSSVREVKLVLAERNGATVPAAAISIAKAPSNIDLLDGMQIALLNWASGDHVALGRSPWYLKDGECLLWKDNTEKDAVEIDPTVKAAAEGRGGAEVGVRIFTPYDDDEDDGATNASTTDSDAV